jgi:hypothetical protein
MAMDTDLASKLLAAARAGDVAQVRALVPCAGNPEEDGPLDALGGVTPLMAAAAGGHEAVVEVLLACGADAARCDARGRRAAAHARAAGHAHLAQRWTCVDKDQTIGEGVPESTAGPAVHYALPNALQSPLDRARQARAARGEAERERSADFGFSHCLA